MVENLEEILRKDNEIITAIKRENFASRTNIIYKSRDTREENSKLASEIVKYKNLNRQKIKELKAATDNLDLARSQKTNYEVIILVLFASLVGLIVYHRRTVARLK
jgi:hypothetical protein